VSEIILIGEYLAKLKQERGCLMHFARLANTLLDDGKSARETTLLLVTLSDVHRFLIFFTQQICFAE